MLRLFRGATGFRHPASAEGPSLVPVGPLNGLCPRLQVNGGQRRQTSWQLTGLEREPVLSPNRPCEESSFHPKEQSCYALSTRLHGESCLRGWGRKEDQLPPQCPFLKSTQTLSPHISAALGSSPSSCIRCQCCYL